MAKNGSVEAPQDSILYAHTTIYRKQMSFPKAPRCTGVQESYDQTHSLELSSQPQQFQPPDNPYQQSESLNDKLEQWEPFHSESDPANNRHFIAEKEENTPDPQEVQARIGYLKKKVALERKNYIKDRIEQNKVKLVGATKNLCRLSHERRDIEIVDQEPSVDLLGKRQKDSNGWQCNTELYNKFFLGVEHVPSSSVETKIAIDNSFCPIKLPEVKKIPTYCTWVFLDRNLRPTEEQALANRRRIYYQRDIGEALICSDSDDDDKVEEEEEKKDFVEAEDHILEKTVQEFGLSDVVVNLLAHCFSRNPSDVKARYECLMKEGEHGDNGNIGGPEMPNFDKDLDAALDSFDNLFCRRCLVFDCKLHGCSQELIFPVEKQTPWSPPDAGKDPCGPNCYLLVARWPLAGPAVRIGSEPSNSKSTSNAKNTSVSSDSEIGPLNDVTASLPPTSPANIDFLGKESVGKRNRKEVQLVLLDTRKRQKKVLTSDGNPMLVSVGVKDLKLPSGSSGDNEDGSPCPGKAKYTNTRKDKRISPALDMEESLQCEALGLPRKNVVGYPPHFSSDGTSREEDINKHKLNYNNCWKPLEKALFQKGLQIFGRNSCLIARNMMNGWKTCFDTFMFMNEHFSQAGDGETADVHDHNKTDGDGTMGKQVRKRRFLRRRGKVRRLKYTTKSSGYPSFRKRIGTTDKLNPHFNPCGCQSSCGKECGCVANGTTCEKYCGCSKRCKNRFRGCHCAKNQCQTRQCPCFAASRECDPDVCKNCWISCGDGTFGSPEQKGDSYECRNMKLMLRQQQGIVLGRSDITGWGAFLKKSVGKEEYIGEYTGEIITHREAEKRGKTYDRENLSYLFNVDDEVVLDAYGMGDKLKFANHSPNPNCYAKILFVGGDNRVAIYSREAINAGEELFYDYNYKLNACPPWAIESASGSNKKGNAGASTSRRARKHVK